MKNFKEIKEDICNYFKISNKELEILINNESKLDYYFYESEDLSYYEKIDYVAIALNCFKNYSKNSINCFNDYVINNDIKINSIIDVGAGIGLTSQMLYELGYKVIYHNIKSLQFEYADSMMNKNIKRVYNFEKSDVAVCLEIFEHIKEPIKYLKDIIDKTQCKYFLISNSFRASAYGHFKEYIVEDKIISNTKIGRIFNKALRDFGYEVIKSFWNGRPTIWKNKNI